MFDLSEAPRCFGVPLGQDYAQSVVAGVFTRLRDAPPEALARVTLLTNSRRMERRISQLFQRQRAGFLPRVLTLADIAHFAPNPTTLPTTSKAQSWLELGDLVGAFLKAFPDLGHPEMRFDLSASLTDLFDEIHGEGLSTDVLDHLDVSDQSGHWERAQRFFGIVKTYFETTSTPEATNRLLVDAILEHWQNRPLQTPLLLVGSTGSRGATARLMDGIAKLPQGAVILPGIDPSYRPIATEFRSDEDHPQNRNWASAVRCETSLSNMPLWEKRVSKLQSSVEVISLALRSAPVTDQWLRDGPLLGDLLPATDRWSLLEARDLSQEALAISLIVRDALQTNSSVAIVTPNRMLTRQISAALGRWNIMPDDSAGRPFSLTPPGQLFTAIAQLFGKELSLADALTLWKLPLVNSATPEGRGEHLRRVRMFEVWMRQGTPKAMSTKQFLYWANHKAGISADDPWSVHLAQELSRIAELSNASFEDYVSALERITESLVAGSNGESANSLWAEDAGKTARDVIDQLKEMVSQQRLSASEFRRFVSLFFNQFQVRDAQTTDPRVMIWGTLEARVGGADLTILAGLNEGIWPEAPDPDPWLSRKMRCDAGLLSPERKIGLSAHDFQIAATSNKVVFSRSKRENDVETVPSRWLNRMTNLIAGLETQNGPQALKAMRDRGGLWTRQAQLQSRKLIVAPPEGRPSPSPPVAVRPRRLSVTQIEKLVRDPYAIYARHVLGLKKLNGLATQTSPALRGTFIHDALHRFLEPGLEPYTEANLANFSRILSEVFEAASLDAATRTLWHGATMRVMPKFLADEASRSEGLIDQKFEADGQVLFPEINFELTARADRLDLKTDGLVLYDYKTGKPPTAGEQKFFNRQLLLEALMAQNGGFETDSEMEIQGAFYLRIGGGVETRAAILEEIPLALVRQDLIDLISNFDLPDAGYTARRRMAKDSYPSDYELLSRFGEWDINSAPVLQVLR